MNTTTNREGDVGASTIQDSNGASRAVAVIETVSNQAFIFGTNRLREAVGASEMIYAAGVDLTLEALGCNADDIAQARQPGGLKNFLQAKNGIEPLLIASGKAILLGPQEKLEEVISRITLAAADRMPGLGVVGGIAEMQDETAGALHEAIRKAHERVAQLRGRLPSPLLRFQRLPVVAECVSSGLPAMGVDDDAPDRNEAVVSEPVCAKRRHRKQGWLRLGQWLTGVKFARDVDKLEEVLQARDARFIAVIHADGNGLGQIFLDFLKVSGVKGDDPYSDYVKKYRAFSLALDECTTAATKAAYEDAVQLLEKLVAEKAANLPEDERKKKEEFRIIPLIIGGDDLTVICDGAMAVPFAAKFLEHFEKKTRGHAGIRAVVGARGLTSAAGIAIVKPHFPFFRAYELAEALLKSAKQVKKKAKGASALHYHVHFDASGADWDRISERLVVDGGKTVLSIQPWVVTTPGKGHNDWSTPRQITHLWQALGTLDLRDDDRTGLPRSQQHALRSALFRGRDIADAHLKRIRHRYDKNFWEDLLPQTTEQSLFVKIGETHHTPLLDVMDLADLGTPPTPDADKADGNRPELQKELQ